MIGAARTSFEEAYAGPIDLPALCSQNSTFEQVADQWRGKLSDRLYGPFPEAPVKLECTREPMTTSRAERLVMQFKLPSGQFKVDAALWLPSGTGPWPLICGLDFIGPAGIMFDQDFPLDQNAIVSPRPELGMHDGKLTDVVRGMSAASWPVALLNDAGFAVMASCYGSWVPDHASEWQERGLKPLMQGSTGALSIWAWSYSRLIDAATTLPEINMDQVSIAGHSRLGKAALWAAANDNRVKATFASSSGAAGAAPFLHKVGESLTQLRQVFPHWLRSDVSVSAEDFDQHALIALASPRAVYIAGAEEDLWADPLGSYLALVAASEAWPDNHGRTWPDAKAAWQPGKQILNGPLGFHLRSGGHALLPYDWVRFVKFLGQLK